MDLTQALAHIRPIQDYPKPGILFQDITPLLSNPQALDRVISELAVIDTSSEMAVGIEARGFILASALAIKRQIGFVPVRKKGKLPFTTVKETYELEYGSATVELHTDAVKPGDRVLLIDDLIATGGTMMAGRKLLEKLGAVVVEGAAIVDLPELGGSEKLEASGLQLFTLIDFSGH